MKSIADMLRAKMAAIRDNGCPFDVDHWSRYAEGTKAEQAETDVMLEEMLRSAFSRPRDRGKQAAIRAKLKADFGFDRVSNAPKVRIPAPTTEAAIQKRLATIEATTSDPRVKASVAIIRGRMATLESSIQEALKGK